MMPSFSALLPPLPPLLTLLSSLSFPLPLFSATTHQGPSEGKWKVYIFCSGAVWQQEGKLLFYGFIYGSVDFWHCAHRTRGAEGKWGAAWCELLLVPSVELQTGKEAEEKCTHAQTHSCIFATLGISYDLMCRQMLSHTHKINSSIYDRILIFTNTSTLWMRLLHSSIKKSIWTVTYHILISKYIICSFDCLHFCFSTDWYQRRVFLSEGQLQPEQCLSPHTLRQTQRCHHKHLMKVAIIAQQMVLTVLVHALAHVMANK